MLTPLRYPKGSVMLAPLRYPKGKVKRGPLRYPKGKVKVEADGAVFAQAASSFSQK